MIFDVVTLTLKVDLLYQKNWPGLWLLNQRGYFLLLFTYGCRRRAMLSFWHLWFIKLGRHVNRAKRMSSIDFGGHRWRLRWALLTNFGFIRILRFVLLYFVFDIHVLYRIYDTREIKGTTLWRRENQLFLEVIACFSCKKF